MICQTNFPCSNAAAEQFTEIISGVIKSVFRRNRRKRQKMNSHIPYDKELQRAKDQWPLLLTWFTFNPRMDM